MSDVEGGCSWTKSDRTRADALRQDTASDLFDAALQDIHTAHAPPAPSDPAVQTVKRSPGAAGGSMPLIRLSPKKILANRTAGRVNGPVEPEQLAGGSAPADNCQSQKAQGTLSEAVYVHQWDLNSAEVLCSSSSSAVAASRSADSDSVPEEPRFISFRSFRQREAAKRQSLLNAQSGSKVMCLRSEKPVYTVVPNVRSAEECHRSGEVQEYSDEVVYFLDSLTQTNSTEVRFLALCNLLQKCVDSSFRYFLKSHRYTDKILLLLVDAPKEETLALCTSCLFYILARDRLSLIVGKATLPILIELVQVAPNGAVPVSKAYAECRCKVWSVLCDWRSRVESSLKNKERIGFDVTEQNLSASILALESLVYISCRNNTLFFMQEMRMCGALEVLARRMTQETDKICSAVNDDEAVLPMLYLYRVLRVLENITAKQEENVGFLISNVNLNCLDNILRMFNYCINRVMEEETSLLLISNQQSEVLCSSDQGSLLMSDFTCLLRFLCNLSNHNDLCCDKLSVRADFIQRCVECVTYVIPSFMPPAERYKFSILIMSFLINFIEHHLSGRRLIATSKVLLREQAIEEEKRKEASTFAAPEALAHLMSEHVANAQQADNEIDQEIVSTEESVQVETVEMKMKALHRTLQSALVKADKHMEECIMAAHLALLLGLLMQEDDLLAERIRPIMPNESFSAVLETLTKFFDFFKQIQSDERAELTISAVIETFKCLA